MSVPNAFRYGLFYLAIPLFCAIPHVAVHAQNTTWTGTESTDWFDSDNWNNGTPASNDGAFIDTTSTNATVVSDQSTNGTATATDVGVGISSTGSLTIENGGVLDVGSTFEIGFNSDSTGTVLITGSGSTLTVATQFSMANSGTATLTVSEGGSLVVDGETTIELFTIGNDSDAEATINIGSASGETAVAPGSITSAADIEISTAKSVTFVFNHTDTETDEYTFSPGIVGDADINVESGYTIFTGDNR